MPARLCSAIAAAGALGLKAPVGVVEDLGAVAVRGDDVDHGDAALAVGVEQRDSALDQRRGALGRERQGGDVGVEVAAVQVDGHDGRALGEGA
jgi:hypothetical protein